MRVMQLYTSKMISGRILNIGNTYEFMVHILSFKFQKFKFSIKEISSLN